MSSTEQAFRKKLEGEQSLTNALALKIFKQIKLESDVLSFLTKPIVFIPLSVALVAASFTLPTTGIVLTAIRIIAYGVACGMLGISMREPFNDFLSHVSQAYSDQSQRAAEHIRTLKTSLESSNQELLILY